MALVSLQLQFVSLKSAATMPLPPPYACACKMLCPRCCAHAAAHPDAHAMIRPISARGVCLRAKFCFHDTLVVSRSVHRIKMGSGSNHVRWFPLARAGEAAVRAGGGDYENVCMARG